MNQITLNCKSVIMFECPITHRLFKTKAGAEKSAAKAQEASKLLKIAAEEMKISEEERLKRADFVRLNLTDVKDLPAMMIAKAAENNVEIKDWNISVHFGNVSNSHGAPIGQATNWSGQDKNRPFSELGWSGRISAMVNKSGQTKSESNSATDVLFGGWGHSLIRGFHTGGGCPGSSVGEYEMDIGFYFFLNDFPILKAKYEEFCAQKLLIKENLSFKMDLEHGADEAAKKDSKVIELNKELEKLTQEINGLSSEVKELYKLLNAPKLNKIAANYGELERIFR